MCKITNKLFELFSIWTFFDEFDIIFRHEERLLILLKDLMLFLEDQMQDENHIHHLEPYLGLRVSLRVCYSQKYK